MPPWPPGKDSLPLQYDRSLSDAQVATIGEWVHEGMFEGNPADHKQLVIGKAGVRADLSLKMPAPYTPSASFGDDYRCYLFNPNLTSDGYLTGYEIKPGIAAMVHHVNLYLVSDPGSIMELEQMSSDSGYACLGGPGGTADTTSRIVGSWEPGAQAVQFPAGTAVRLPKGARLVLLIHYITQNVREPDTTGVDLQLGDRPDKEATVLALRNDTFLVPPGAIGFAVHTEQQLSGSFAASAIYAVFPHMHLFGKAISVHLLRRNGSDLTIIDIPEWRYHWQGMYFLVDKLEVHPDDQLRLTCVYDNLTDPPRTLTWGNRANDEMCLAYLYVTNAK
jgi:hypothetical protein